MNDLMAAYGGMQVETPIMYDYNHPHLARYLERFPARQYILRSEEKEYFLRFAACFAFASTFSWSFLSRSFETLSSFCHRTATQTNIAMLKRTARSAVASSSFGLRLLRAMK
jgi:hypothetical protein